MIPDPVTQAAASAQTATLPDSGVVTADSSSYKLRLCWALPACAMHCYS